MAFGRVSILIGFAVIFLAGPSAAFAEDGYEGDDSEWPAGISPLDSLSYWSDDIDGGRDAEVADGMNGCCLPKTWTGKLFTEVRREGGRPRARPGPKSRTLRLLETVYVDQVNKRIAEDVVIPRRPRNATRVSFILLFQDSSATLYTFSKTAKRCVKKELKGAQLRPQCLPANATLLGSFTFGAGSGALKSQSWGYLYRDRRVALAANVILTPGNCVPILAAEKVFVRPRMSDDNDPEKKRAQVTDIGAIYTDVATRIPDPSVFTPPSYCNKDDDETLTFDPDVDVTTIIERFVAVP